MKNPVRILLALLASLVLAFAASRPNSAPVHGTEGQVVTLRRIADYSQRFADSTLAATRPTEAPVHGTESAETLLRRIADYTQDAADETIKHSTKALQVEAFGARANDGIDDRQAFQDALDAAEATGPGGRVEMGPGIYDIVTIFSPATANKIAGGLGIEMPSYTTLAGVGKASQIRAAHGGEWGVGVVISPKGMRTATTNYGAATGITLTDFSIWTPVQHESAGNLINAVHTSNLTLSGLYIGGCYYHGLEMDMSRDIVVRDCTWSGAYTGLSGSWIQFDFGVAGPVNKPGTITATDVSNVVFDNCVGLQRVAGESSAQRDIELAHNGTALIVKNVLFRNCQFTGRAEQFVSIADIGGNTNTGGEMNDIAFERCIFITTHPKSYAFYAIQALGQKINGLRFTDCEFRGPSGSFIIAGGNTSATYNATHDLRRNLEIRGCRFLYDKTQMPASFDMNLIIANAWTNVTIADNRIDAIGEFPVSVGQNYCRIVLAAQNLSTRIVNNQIIWNGNTTFGVQRSGIVVDTSLADVAGFTRSVVVDNNYMHGTSATGWNYPIIVSGGATAPASKAFAVVANGANCANSFQNNAVVTGLYSTAVQSLSAPRESVRTVTANTTATAADATILANSTSGNITVTLEAVIQRSTLYVVKTVAANSVIVGGVTLTGVNTVAKVVSDGTTTFVYQIQ